jgi:hypothetical protein
MPFMLTRRCEGCSTALPLKAASKQCQQFRTIHNFHRFIHRLSSAKIPLEPVNL